MSFVPRITTPVLVSSADDRYAMPLAVMLKSAMLHIGGAGRLLVYVMDGGISRKSKARILDSVSDPRMTLEWVLPLKKMVFGLPVFGHVRVSTYYRILIPDLLPLSVEKAIYLDADCLVLADLGELWSIPMAGRPLLAVPERGMTVASPGLPHYRELGIPPETKCLNGGLLVMDLSCWRNHSVSAKILAYLRENSSAVRFWDQDGLNAVLAQKWGELEGKWNYRVDCAQAPVPGYDTPADLERQAAIIHFASAAKPWHYFSGHPAKALFFKHLDQTAWAGWRPRPPLRALLNKHYWGARCRSLPLIGPLWKGIRSRMGASTNSSSAAQEPTTKHQPPSTKNQPPSTKH
jgi:lipopolysaccharide biosynthesis glycosyltransferase